MTHASLFSGIGGPEVAAEMLGWTNLFHCEINPFGRAVLAYHFPESVSYEDITKTDFTQWRGRVDVLTGGFPCQPFSYAGKRGGADDDRYLWPQMCRAIQECQPTWVVGENVAGLATMVEQCEITELGAQPTLFEAVEAVPESLYEERGRYTIDRICQDLEAIGSSNRFLFRLAVSELPTDATEYSSSAMLKTPCAADSWSDSMESKGVSGTSGTLAQEIVSGYAEKHRGLLLPTPQATDWNTTLSPEAKERCLERNMDVTPSCTYQLRQMAADGMLPSPRSTDWNTCCPHGEGGMSLKETIAQSLDEEQDGKGFRLSPLFTEEMMGFPFLWTTLPFLSPNGAQKVSKPTETPSSRK